MLLPEQLGLVYQSATPKERNGLSALSVVVDMAAQVGILVCYSLTREAEEALKLTAESAD